MEAFGKGPAIGAENQLKRQAQFTAGVQEVRAWTIHQGDTGPEAAGVIHSEFQKSLHPRRGDGVH